MPARKKMNKAKAFIQNRLQSIMNNKERFPLSIGVTMFTNMIFYSMVSTVLFSFAPQMVKGFGASEIETGTYAGLLASSFYIGQFCFSMLWGYIADTMNKTHALLIAGSALITTTILFGLSLDFYWAIVSRFLQGSSMGHLILFKAIVTEICDEKNVAFGLSILMSAFTIGSILGPSIGGFLAFPDTQYPSVFPARNIFSRYGILLPNFVLAVGVALGMILVLLFIPRGKKKERHVIGGEARNDDEGAEEAKDEETRSLVSSAYVQKYGSVNAHDTSGSSTSSDIEFSKHSSTGGCFRKLKNSKFMQICCTKEAMMTSFLYALFSMVDIGYNEILPVLTSTSAAYRGMGFTPSQIGTLLMIAPAIYFVPQFTVIPNLTTRIGAKRTFIVANLVLVLAYSLLPVASAIRNHTGIYVCLITIIVVVRMSVFGGALSINILVNNSVAPNLLGTVNGAAMSFAALGRMVAPVVFGGIYSWSLNNIVGIRENSDPLGFPFNQFLTFFVLSLVSLLIALITTCLGDSIDRQKM